MELTCPSCGYRLDLVSAETGPRQPTHDAARADSDALPRNDVDVTSSQLSTAVAGASTTGDGTVHYESNPAAGGAPTSHKPDFPRPFGEYELLSELGHGGMGVVYRALQRSANRVVALKVIRADRIANSPHKHRQLALARFRIEAQLTASLVHEHLVTVFDVGQVDGDPYYSMRFVEGHSMMELLRDRPLENRLAARYLESVARGVEEAHQHGILHRDLKPHNVLIETKGDRALVADFGLAKLAEGDSGLSISGEVFGTPPYMSPEQAVDSSKVTTLSDVYGLGATLYHALTGRPPIQAPTVVETLKQVVEQDPAPPRQLNAAVARDLETICLKALAKEPIGRYASAGALADDLGRWLRGEPILAQPIGRVARGWRWCKRQPVVAGLMGAVALTLVLGTLVSSFFAVRANVRAEEAIAERERVRHMLYDSDLILAQKSWEDGNVRQMLHLLEEHRPSADQNNLTGWEWAYLWNLSHRDLRTLKGHELGVYGVAFSPNGQFVASCSEDGDIRVWDVDTGAAATAPLKSDGVIFEIAFSPDGSQIASGSDVGGVQVRNVMTGAEVATLERGDGYEIGCVAFSPDGMWIARSSADTTIKIWNTITWALLSTLQGHTDMVHRITFTPDSKQLVSVSQDKKVLLWNVAPDSEPIIVGEDKNPVWSIAITPDGKQVASGNDRGGITVWELENSTKLAEWNAHDDRVYSLAFTPDGKRLVSGGDKSIRLWNATTGHRLGAIEGHLDFVAGVTVSPDGKRIASTGDTDVKLWDMDSLSGLLELHLPDGNPISGGVIAVSSEGNRVISSGLDEEEYKLWNINGKTELATLGTIGATIQSPLFTNDGKRIVAETIDDSIAVRVWDAETGDELTPLGEGLSTCNLAHSISPDSKLIAMQDNENSIIVLDIATGAVFSTLEGHTASVKSVSFSPDCRRLVSICFDNTIAVWDIETGVALPAWQDHDDPEGVSFTPDGTRIVARTQSGEAIKLWQASTGALLKTFKPVGVFYAPPVFSPDGSVFATRATRITPFASSVENTIMLWDTQSGAELRTLIGHTQAVQDLVFSRDGKRLASASWDKTIKIWDVKTGANLTTIGGHTSSIEKIGFTKYEDQLWAILQEPTSTVYLHDARIFSDDEKMGRFLGRTITEEKPLLKDALSEVDKQTRWNDVMREAARAYIRSAISTR